jgi:uncharacterized protein YegP (UPF0339 family)
MAGRGEIFRGSDGRWAFRVKASNGKVVATDGGPPGYESKTQARRILGRLLRGEDRKSVV